MRRIDDDSYTQPTIAGPLFDSGPFDRSPLGQAQSLSEGIIAKLVWDHQGRDNPISIARICANTDLSEREVKGIVSGLRTEHKMPIGARRGASNEQEATAGYFWIRDAEDREIAVAPYRGQILTMWNTLRSMDSRQNLQRLRDKMTVEADQ